MNTLETTEELRRNAKREALQSVLELLKNDNWVEPVDARETRLQLARWLDYRIGLFDRGIWSAIPGGEGADIARQELEEA